MPRINKEQKTSNPEPIKTRPKESKQDNLTTLLKLTTGLVIGIQLIIIIALSISKPVIPPENIRVGNVTDTTLTLSWTTEKATQSYLVISSTPDRALRVLSFLLCELFSYRCNILPSEIPTPKTTHLVNIKGLSPNSFYYYRIVSGGRFFKYDREGRLLPPIKSGPVLPTLSLPNPVYSYILRGDGKTPVVSALVTVTLVDKNDLKLKSSSLTTLTDAKGRWTIDLGNLRTPDFKDSIPVTLGDRLSITILGQNGIRSTSFVEYSQKELKPMIVKKASL